MNYYHIHRFHFLFCRIWTIIPWSYTKCWTRR